MAHKEKTLYTIHVVLTSWETIEHKFNARDLGLLVTNLKEKSFIKIGLYYINRINIAFIQFPYDCILEDLNYIASINVDKEYDLRLKEMQEFEQRYNYRENRSEEFGEN